MAMTPAERQRAYRARQAAHPVERLQVPLPSDLKHRLEIRAATERLPLAEVVRQALEAHLAPAKPARRAIIKAKPAQPAAAQPTIEPPTAPRDAREARVEIHRISAGMDQASPLARVLNILVQRVWAPRMELDLGPLLRAPHREGVIAGLKGSDFIRGCLPKLLDGMELLPTEMRRRVEAAIAEAAKA